MFKRNSRNKSKIKNKVKIENKVKNKIKNKIKNKVKNKIKTFHTEAAEPRRRSTDLLKGTATTPVLLCGAVRSV
jgi:hypothetical protein